MILRNKIGPLFWLAMGLALQGVSQRSYAPHSVLATGNWYRIAVAGPGVYRVDVAFLNGLGINSSGLSSSSIRLFGNGGEMLPESNAAPRPDDLVENAIWVSDGGDGLFNGSDYFLFYAPGPDTWVKDSLNRRFSFRKNIYSDRSYYFLSVGGTGNRITVSPAGSAPDITVTSYSERLFHELDTVNFLSSGKEWYGEELSDLPGRSLTRSFSLPLSDVPAGSPVQLSYRCAARSVGAGSRFDVRLNGQAVAQLPIGAVPGGLYDLFAREGGGVATGSAAGNSVSVSFSFVPGAFNAQGWINRFELFARRNLVMGSEPALFFRDWNSVGSGRAQFVIGNAPAGLVVWEVTDPLNPSQVTGNASGSEYRFIRPADRLREYVAVNLSQAVALPVPTALGKIGNQDLHASTPADMILVCHASLLGEAQRLAGIHRQRNGLRTAVVTTEQAYHEFSGGSPDPVAIRDLAKMYYDRYRSQPGDQPKYLLLMGDASFDYLGRLSNNTSLVPAWQNDLALDPLSTYASDDFFGYLDDGEDINSGLVSNLLDLGIGRIPAATPLQAKNFVDKVADYYAAAAFGPWRSQLTFVADDEDNNLHFQDAEQVTATASATAPLYNIRKVYLDAFHQESGAGGSSYPEATQLSNNQVFNGTLIWNYNGHGGSSRLAEEVVLDQSAINGWKNAFRLPLFITATCDVAPYDNPAIRSIGEDILLRAKTGGIALMTTTRPVFAFSNRVMNDNYLRFALQRDASGNYRSLGEAVRDAKNFTYQTLPDVANNRKFTLLGDPALTLAFPVQNVTVTRVNGIPAAQADTLSAEEMVTVEGEVRDNQGGVLSGYNGYVYPTVYDKEQTVSTRANDPGSQAAPFRVQNNILFKGKASVSGGRFRFGFRVPRDINYQYGAGRMSLYAENGQTDAAGVFTGFLVGGAGTGAGSDREGPRLKAWLNDRLFVSGGITNRAPVLLLQLEDSSGINTTSTGIGHDITATLDNDNRQYYVLNDFYQAEPDSYQRGQVSFQLPELEPGPHTLRLQAWDVVNNSSEIVLDFIVTDDAELQLSRVLNYPNPFTTHTTFWFDHNQPGMALRVEVQVMTLTGRVVRTLRETLTSEGNRSASLEWDARDEYGDKVGRGVYLYRLRVTAPGKKPKDHTGKLVVL